jgi:hypothetical protein
VLALHVKDLLAGVALLAAYSLFAALLFAGVWRSTSRSSRRRSAPG